MKFGERLKTLRRRSGLSQQEVADKIGISLRAYAAYETKNVRPRKMETYEKLADILSCEVNELLVEDTNKPSAKLLAGLGLFGLGTSLTGSIGALAAAAVTPLAYSILNRNEGKEALDEWEREQNRIALQYERRVKRFSTAAIGMILTELGKKGISCRVGEVKDLAIKGSVPDDYIILDNHEVNEWWFVFWCSENRENEQYFISNEGRTYLLFNRFGPTIPDPKRKASIILDDEEMFKAICKLKGRNSYRGNLTVILIDVDESKIIKEELLSSFNMNDTEDKLAIIRKEE